MEDFFHFIWLERIISPDLDSWLTAWWGLLVLVKDISLSLLIASLELSVLGAVDLLRNEFEVTGDGLCVYQLCWNWLRLIQLATNKNASNNAIRIGNELDSNSERIHRSDFGSRTRSMNAWAPDTDPAWIQRAGTTNQIRCDCDSQSELDWSSITMIDNDNESWWSTIGFDWSYFWLRNFRNVRSLTGNATGTKNFILFSKEIYR